MMVLAVGLYYIVLVGGGLLAIGLSANAIWRAVMPPAGLPRGASCGSCGYELGAIAERCSECGADLLKAGIMTRRNAIRMAGSLPAALMGWTVIATALGGVAFGITMAVVFARQGGQLVSQNYAATVRLAPMAHLHDDGRTYAPSADYTVVFDVDVVGAWGAPADSGSITVTVRGPDRESVVVMNAQSGAWQLFDHAGAEVASGIAFDPDDAAEVYRLAGLDVAENAALNHESSQLGGLLNRAYDDPFNIDNDAITTLGLVGMQPDQALGGLRRTGATTNFNPMAGFSAGLVESMAVSGVVLIIWGVGIVLIVRRRAKVIRDPRPEPGRPAPAG